MDESTNNVMNLIIGKTKLDRDKGLASLQTMLNEGVSTGNVANFETQILSILNNKELHWEEHLGAFLAANEILKLKFAECSPNFINSIKELAFSYLKEDAESRVRLASGDIIGTLSGKIGNKVFTDNRNLFLENISFLLERKHEVEDENLVLKEKLGQSSEIFHESAGWQSLETWLKCLQNVVEAEDAGTRTSTIDTEMLGVIYKTLDHTNRFVRETGYFLIGSLVVNLSGDLKEILSWIVKGLADNWSQVRMASSKAARNFLLSVPEDTKSKFYSSLLPAICINRYYVAEGVRVYSQETWRLTCSDHGKDLVEQNIGSFVEFYVSQSEADNHAVREAACACIAELGQKIEKTVLQGHVNTLINALLVCFKDDSWPVRDAACVACGNFVHAFPNECVNRLEELLNLFLDNLQDSIPSVREGAAEALGKIAFAYKDTSCYVLLQNKLSGVIESCLVGVKDQSEQSKRLLGVEYVPSAFGLVKRIEQENDEADGHSNQQMYSCGSLAPKMHRAKDGCMDTQFKRPAEPWEKADGCIMLMKALASLADFKIEEKLQLLTQAVSFHHYEHHWYLLETLFKNLPSLAKAIGKRNFKRHLELFFNPIFYTLQSTGENRLALSAAEQCLCALSQLLGPNIVRGRIELYNRTYLPAFDRLCLI